MVKCLFFSVLSFTLLFLSCNANRQVLFPVQGTGVPLLAMSREAQAGTLDFSRPGRLEFRFDGAFSAPVFSSLEIEYDFSYLPSGEIIENYRLVLETADTSWVLPMDISFLGVTLHENAVFHYAVPITNSFNGRFNIVLQPINGAAGISSGRPVLQIRSVGFSERWFGFNTSERNGRKHFFLSPFVFMDNGNITVDLPEVFGTGQNQLRPHIVLPYKPTNRVYYLPAAHLRSVSFAGPIAACPRAIIDWPQENWRDSRFEVFAWDRFPEIIIFDTENFDIQARLFKRLAFFVEKAGFRGRLSFDEEIADLHGWNAHNYRAQDLAAFFQLARDTNFPLLDEEWELEYILYRAGVLRRDPFSQRIIPGRGAVLSISQERSHARLRTRFMNHEVFHGLYFIDEDFQRFSRERWDMFPNFARNFFLAWLEVQEYDTGYDFLVINEFMGHILQYPVANAAWYFGEHLPNLILTRAPHLGIYLPATQELTEAGRRFWPCLAEIFTAETEAFSAYVNQRWGLAAGRVWELR